MYGMTWFILKKNHYMYAFTYFNIEDLIIYYYYIKIIGEWLLLAG